MNIDFSNDKFSDALGNSIDTLNKKPLISSYFESQEIEEIGDCFYITNKKKGIGFVFDQFKILIAIHFHSRAKGYDTFEDALPYNITFEDNIETVHNKLGLKNFDSGGGEVLPILGPSNLWRRYNYSDYYLNIEFNKQGILVLITLGLMR